MGRDRSRARVTARSRAVRYAVVATVALVTGASSGIGAATARLLSERGFDVLTAADGREGVEIFGSRPDEIAVVFLDLTMPEMGGGEALEKIRRIRPDAKVILSSGYAEEDLKQRFAGKGASGFIHKPFKIRDLVAMLRGVLES